MSEVKCKHHFEPVKEVSEKWKKNYVSSTHGYDYATIKEERILIFCNKCGENKCISDVVTMSN